MAPEMSNCQFLQNIPPFLFAVFFSHKCRKQERNYSW